MKKSNLIILILAICCFTLGCAQQFILGVPQQVADSCGVELSAIGTLQSTFGLCNAIFTPVMVALSSRMGPKRQLLTGIALMAAGLAVTSISDDFGLLVAARGVMGVGNGTYVATAYAVAADIAEPDRKASAMANVALGFSAASVLAIPVARSTADVITWHQGYLALTVLSVVGFVAISLLVPQLGAGEGDAQPSMAERLATLGNRSVLFGLLAVAAMFTAMQATYVFVTPLLEGILPDATLVSPVMFGIGLMSLVGAKGGGTLADRIGLGRVLIGSLGMQVVALAVAATFVGVPAFAVAGIALWMVGLWAFLPSQNLLLAKAAKGSSNVAVSLSNSCVQLGNAMGSALGGALIGALGVLRLPWVSLAATVVAILLELVALKASGER